MSPTVNVAEQFYSLQGSHLTPGVVSPYMGETCPDCGEEFKNKRGVRVHAARKGCDVPSVKEERTCKVCGSSFECYPSVIRETCGGECADLARKETLEGINTGDGETVVVKCDWCGDEFERWASQIEKYDHHFCDRECRGGWQTENFQGEDNGFWKGGWSPRPFGENWYEVREEVIQRDGEVCQDCGLGRDRHQELHGSDLHVHHLVPRAEFEDVNDANDPENLITVCNPCHQRREQA